LVDAADPGWVRTRMGGSGGPSSERVASHPMVSARGGAFRMVTKAIVEVPPHVLDEGKRGPPGPP